jgi:hypothetical protein
VKVERRIPALAALLALAVATVPVHAHDHTPPKVTLKTSKGSQRGALWESRWANGFDYGTSGGGCVVMVAIGAEGFPDQPVGFAAGEEVTIVFAKRQKPRAVALEAWPVDPTTVTQAPSEGVDFRLQKYKVGDERRWRVAFTPPFPVEDYLHLYVRWQDTGGCGTESLDLGFWMRVSP